MNISYELYSVCRFSIQLKLKTTDLVEKYAFVIIQDSLFLEVKN